MPPAEWITLIIQGGAVVVLAFWVWDLRRQRDQERAERMSNSAVMATMSDALKDLTSAIEQAVWPRTGATRSRR